MKPVINRIAFAISAMLLSLFVFTGCGEKTASDGDQPAPAVDSVASNVDSTAPAGEQAEVTSLAILSPGLWRWNTASDYIEVHTKLADEVKVSFTGNLAMRVNIALEDGTPVFEAVCPDPKTFALAPATKYKITTWYNANETCPLNPNVKFDTLEKHTDVAQADTLVFKVPNVPQPPAITIELRYVNEESH